MDISEMFYKKPSFKVWVGKFLFFKKMKIYSLDKYTIETRLHFEDKYTKEKMDKLLTRELGSEADLIALDITYYLSNAKKDFKTLEMFRKGLNLKESSDAITAMIAAMGFATKNILSKAEKKARDIQVARMTDGEKKN